MSKRLVVTVRGYDEEKDDLSTIGYLSHSGAGGVVAEPSGDVALENILMRPISKRRGAEQVWPHLSPEEWLRGLHRVYKSPYLYCGPVVEVDDQSPQAGSYDGDLKLEDCSSDPLGLCQPKEGSEDERGDLGRRPR